MNETTERYGREMDLRSARIVDNLDEAFADSTWSICRYSSLAINKNRHFDIQDDSGDTILLPQHKVSRDAFDAIHEAGLRVTGVLTFEEDSRGSDHARIWVEEL